MYAAATASRVAYSTYIYTQVPVSKFQIVTAYTKAALLTGRCVAGLLGQTLILTGVCDYSTLNYISLGFVSFSTVISCLLPSVSHSIYFHRGQRREEQKIKELVVVKESKNLCIEKGDQLQCSTNLIRSATPDHTDHNSKSTKTPVHRLLWIDFTTAFSDTYTLKWSLWWAFATCGFFQVVNYIQPLWEALAPPDSGLVYNGGVEALNALLGIYFFFFTKVTMLFVFNFEIKSLFKALCVL